MTKSTVTLNLFQGLHFLGCKIYTIIKYSVFIREIRGHNHPIPLLETAHIVPPMVTRIPVAIKFITNHSGLLYNVLTVKSNNSHACSHDRYDDHDHRNLMLLFYLMLMAYSLKLSLVTFSEGY